MMKSRIVVAKGKQAGSNVESLQRREITTREAGLNGILAEFAAQDAAN
jgi:hypothetical protein